MNLRRLMLWQLGGTADEARTAVSEQRLGPVGWHLEVTLRGTWKGGERKHTGKVDCPAGEDPEAALDALVERIVEEYEAALATAVALTAEPAPGTTPRTP